MAEIDTARRVYVFVHGRADLRPKAAAALESRGFAAGMMEDASPSKAGETGEYMAMLWPPGSPDQIKLQRITGVEPVEPEGMIGLWKGVSKEDVESIPL